MKLETKLGRFDPMNNIAFWLAFFAAVIPVLSAWKLDRPLTIWAAFLAAVLGISGQVLRGVSTERLQSGFASLQANRWEPLSGSETEALRAKLLAFPPPPQTVQILCALPGCGDLTETLERALRMPGWKVTRVPAYANDVPDGIEFWYRDVSALRIAEALEIATAGRLKPQPRPFLQVEDYGQINIAIGRKP